MADSPFPARKTSGGGGMTATSGSMLDGPPPSPMMAGAPSTLIPGQGPGPMPSFGEMAAPLTAGSPGRVVSPEIAVGLMQTAETIYGVLDSMASIAPDLANDFALQKDLLQRTMGKLLLQGGQPSSPTSLGLNFPGGGFSSGAV